MPQDEDDQILHAECDLFYEAADTSTVLMTVQTARNEYQEVVGETIHIDREADWHEWTEESTGNRHIRMTVEAGTGSVRYRAEVRPRAYLRDKGGSPQFADSLPVETLSFLRPSRYCPADQMSGFAFNQFGEKSPTQQFVEEISQWVRANTAYRPGASGPTTTALDTLHAGAGVCRDFVHLMVALCRALGIPARYVSVYAVGLKPPDFHAVAEVFCEGRWVTFDPTGLADVTKVARIAEGYDAAEVPFATWFGKGTFTNISVDCAEGR